MCSGTWGRSDRPRLGEQPAIAAVPLHQPPSLGPTLHLPTFRSFRSRVLPLRVHESDVRATPHAHAIHWIDVAGLPCAEIGVCGSLSLSEWFTRSLLRSFLHKPQHSKHTRLHKSQNAETRSVLNTKTCFGTNSETNIYLHDVMMPMCYVKRRDSTSHIM